MPDKYFFKSKDKLESWEQLKFEFQNNQETNMSVMDNDKYSISESEKYIIEKKMNNIKNSSSLKIIRPLNDNQIDFKDISNSQSQKEVDSTPLSNLKSVKKKYYLIGEVSDMLKISTSNIRFWESQIDVLKPKKKRDGKRHFTAYDIRLIYLVFLFIKKKKWTIQACNDFFKQNFSYLKTYYQYLEKLIYARNKISELIINL